MKCNKMSTNTLPVCDEVANVVVKGRPAGVFLDFLVKRHEKRGNFYIFLLKIAVKEGKTDQSAKILRRLGHQRLIVTIVQAVICPP